MYRSRRRWPIALSCRWPASCRPFVGPVHGRRPSGALLRSRVKPRRRRRARRNAGLLLTGWLALVGDQRGERAVAGSDPPVTVAGRCLPGAAPALLRHGLAVLLGRAPR